MERSPRGTTEASLSGTIEGSPAWTRHAGNINVVYTARYEFRRYRGGSMCYTGTVGLKGIRGRILQCKHVLDPQCGTPVPLLKKLALEGMRCGR